MFKRIAVSSCNLFVISGYAPQDGNTGMQRDEFYYELATFVCRSKRPEIALPGGDFDAQLNKQWLTWMGVVALPVENTDNCDRLLHLCVDDW